MKTVICVILDESGSMAGIESEVIDGYNHFISDQLQVGGGARLHLVKFSDDVTFVHRDLQLSRVPVLNINSYRPFGRTALFDAIADGINSVSSTKRNDERAVVVIITDGKEYASRRFNEVQVQDMIAECKARRDWTFVYVGERSKQFADKMRIPAKNAIEFCRNKIRANFEVVSAACTIVRSNKLKASYALL